MSQPEDIESALRQAFLTAIPAAANLTAFENQKFDPKAKAKWYIFNFLPNEPTPKTLGDVGQDLYTGICQIDINVEPNKGKSDIDADMIALRSVFTAGARCAYSSAVVTIKSCGRKGGGRLVDSFYRFNVSISWECRLSRN